MRTVNAALIGMLMLLSLPSTAKTYALAIGVADYPTPLARDGTPLKDADGAVIDFDLKGPVNDARAFTRLLTETYGIAAANVRLLTDRGATSAAFLDGMKWLIGVVEPGDEVFFFFSGHGVQVPVRDSTESDGTEEAIVLYDTLVLDDTLKVAADIIADFGAHFFIVVDSCHGGGMSRDAFKRVKSVRAGDLGHLAQKRVQRDTVGASAAGTPTRSASPRGGVTLIAAGQENQPTIDVSFRDGSPAHGIFTLVFTTLLRERPSLTIEAAVTLTTELLKRAKYDQVPHVETTVPSRLKESLVTTRTR